MNQKRIKRIKARTAIITVDDFAGIQPCYVILKSDVRALAEQMADEHVDCWNSSQDPYRNTVNIMLRVLKRHGITPGRARKGGKP